MTRYLDTWTRDRKHKQSIAQRLELAFLPQPRTLIGSLDPTALARQVDISHWQQEVDIQRMVAEGDVALVFPKCSDGKQVQAGDPTVAKNYVDDWLYRNVQKCYDAKIPCAPYHYVQPYFPDYTKDGTVAWNMKTLHAALDPLTPNVSYHAIVLDIEEKNTTDPNGSGVVLGMMEKIAADPKMSQVPLIVYTSMSVLNYYTGLREQISHPTANKNLWMAQWVYNTVTTTTWANLIAKIMPGISMKVLTPGYANWKFLQWSSSFILPGGSGRTDLNFYNGTKAALYSWLKYAPVTPPVEPPPLPPQTDLGAQVEANTAAIAGILTRLDKHILP